MAVRLTICEVGDPGSEYERNFIGDRIVLGRARSADVCLPDMAVSTRHAEVRLTGSDYAVVDLDSLNGTRVGEVELVAHRPRILSNGDEIEIAGFRICFNLGGAARGDDSRDLPHRHAREMGVKQALRRGGERSPVHALVVTGGPGRAKRFELGAGPQKQVIGRGSDADISLDDSDVSRRHAEVAVERDGVFVRDLGSRNGLIVAEERVEAVRIEPGLGFRVGSTTLELEHPADRSLAAIFEAPEEETSSFSPRSIAAPDVSQVAEEPPPAADGEPADAPPGTSRPPVGPADPLIDAPSRPPSRTTGHIPRPVLDDDRGDLGLIIVGVIIVVAAVAGLAYLFS